MIHDYGVRLVRQKTFEVVQSHFVDIQCTGLEVLLKEEFLQLEVSLQLESLLFLGCQMVAVFLFDFLRLWGAVRFIVGDWLHLHGRFRVLELVLLDGCLDWRLRYALDLAWLDNLLWQGVLA